MAKFDLVIVTDSRFINPPKVDDYIQTVLDEEAYVKEALEHHNLKVIRKAWDDVDFDWSSTKSILFRSTWDYFKKFEAFTKWLKKVTATTRAINSAELVWWNLNKKYLAELKQKGVRIVPTHFIPKGETKTLLDLHEQNGWKETVLKPTVGAGGYLTYRLHKNDLPEKEQEFKKMIRKQDFMLQPFQRTITKKGEWSFVFFGHTFSHAVLKKSKGDDFRVQDDFGGTVHEYQPSKEEVDFALKAVEACPAEPAYSRVDVVLDNEGRLAVSEVELVEPELWFRQNPGAAFLLAEEILKRL